MIRKTILCLVSLSVFTLSACGGGSDEKSDIAPTVSTPAAAVEKKQADRGQILYKKCRTCHTLNQDGKHKVGPNLYNIINAAAGKKEGFNYSKAMMSTDVVWTEANLDAYLERPSKFMPGTQMAFVGIRKPEDRKLLIEYLKKETAP